MKSDVEQLLVLAARAAFVKIRPPNWAPHTHDADSLLLAVKLRINVTFHSSPEGEAVQATASEHPDIAVSCVELLGRDAYASTRLVILRMAAEIGRTFNPRIE